MFTVSFGQKYQSNWLSLRQNPTPQWLQDGKFCIYTHWGPYAVHAYGSNPTWYSRGLYLHDVGEDVHLIFGGKKWRTASYDGSKFKEKSGSGRSVTHPGFYQESIRRITMLGDDTELEWAFTKAGLAIKTPKKVGNYAYSFKIERYHHPKIK